MYKEIFRWVIAIISEGVGLVSEKRREAGGVLIPIRVSFDRLRYCCGFSGRIVYAEGV